MRYSHTAQNRHFSPCPCVCQRPGVSCRRGHLQRHLDDGHRSRAGEKMGRSVLIVAPDQHLGGLSSGGLGSTDTGNKSAIGGLAREFYHRIWQHYQNDNALKWQPR